MLYAWVEGELRWLGSRRFWILFAGLLGITALCLAGAWLRIGSRPAAELPVASVVGPVAIVPGDRAAYRVVVRDAARGGPLAGARVDTLILPPYQSLMALARPVSDRAVYTNSEGVAEIEVRIAPELPAGDYVLHFRIAGARNHIAESLRVTVGPAALRSFLSTDKPSYQPGQVVHLRALTLSDGNGRPAAGMEGTIEIRDPKGTKLFKQRGVLSKHGLIAADFELADQVLLGEYTGAVLVAGTEHERRFRVERYTLPSFRVALTTDKPSCLSTDTLRATVQATYTFGKPVTDAAVRVLLGSGRGRRGPFAVVEGTTDDAGRFQFARAVQRLPRHSQLGVVSMDASVTAPNGDEQARSLTVPITVTALTVEAVPERSSLIPGLEQIVYVVTRHGDGSPVAATVRLDPGGQTAKSTGSGVATLKVTPSSERKKWMITATDEVGRSGGTSFEPEIDNDSGALLLRTDRSLYRKGESIAVEVLSAEPERSCIRVNLLHHGRVAAFATSNEAVGRWTLSLPITPGISSTVALFAERVEAQPNNRWRQAEALRWVQVAGVDDLQVDITADRPRFRPAQTARLDIQVRTQDGRPVAAALGLAAVDEAVFARLETRPDLERLFFRVPDLEVASGYPVEPRLPSQKLTLLDPALEAELPRAALLAALPRRSHLHRWEGTCATEVQEQVADGVRSSRLVLGVVATSLPLLGYVLIALLLLAYGWSRLRHLPPVERATADDLAAHRRGLGGLMRWWIAGLYLPAAAFLLSVVVLIQVLGWRDGTSLTVAILLFAVATLGCTLGLARSAGRWSRRDLSRAFPSLGKLLRLLPVMCMLGNLGVPALAVAISRWLWDVLPLWHTLIAWVAALTALGLGQLVVGVLSAARRAPQGGGARRGLTWRLVTRPLFAGLPLTIVVLAFAIHNNAERRARFEAALWERPPDPISASSRGNTWGDSIEVWGRDDSLGTPGAESSPDVRIRQDFPETLLWKPEVVTDALGRARIEVPLADSITTWRVSASAVTTAGQLGSTTTGLEVFQSFFVDAVLPVALTQHDEVTVPVSIYSYVDEAQTVTLSVAAADWFELLGETTTEIVVEPRQVSRMDVRLRALEPGKHELTLRASTPTVADAVRRAVTVHPDGRAVTEVVNRRLSGKATIDVTVAEDAIAGAGELFLKLYPSPISQVSEGLDGIFRKPHGCFEQTSSTTYPSVLALAFLKRSGLANPEMARKAQRYIDLGYQRLLSFEVEGGGFSLFGKPPAKAALTAYGLLQFTDMSQVRHVDPKLLARTRRWLYAQQSPDGWWRASRQEAAGDDDLLGRLRTTAYIAWALAESGDRDPKLHQALDQLDQTDHAIAKDPYLMALTANALVAAGRRDAARPWLSRLDRTATKEKHDTHWAPDTRGVFWTRNESLAVETTALAVQALLRDGQQVETARSALQWLANRRDRYGTWSSTQATIQALRAMLADESATPTEEQAVVVQIDAAPVATLRIEKDQRDVLKLLDLRQHQRKGSLPIGLELTGGGQLDVQLLSSYYLPWDSAGGAQVDGGPLSLQVRHAPTTVAQGELVRCEIELRWQPSEPAGMLVIEVGRPPGFDVVQRDLAKLTRDGTIARYELEPRRVRLYLNRLSSQSAFAASFGLLAQQRAEVRTPPSGAYLYYEPEVRAVAPPVTLRIR